MAEIKTITQALVGLRNGFSGDLLRPGDSQYEEARKVHNGLIDRHPALIARCRTVADVVHAVTMARDLGLEVAVRGGGHNVAGRATIDGGIVIDLSSMKGISVAPRSRTARVEGGCTWAELNRQTQQHGLAVTGGVVSSTGVAGLTLGGGLGWLMGKHGLALDNLLAVELVTARGDVVRASNDEHPDLFWAVRGGGGNFGVVTAFEFQLHPIGPTVVGGLFAHPFERARDVLRHFRSCATFAPDEHTTVGGLLRAPDGSGMKLAGMVTCHCGPIAAAESAVQQMKGLGSPVVDTIGPMDYCALNSMLDGAYPKGALNYWKSSFLADLGDAAIDAAIGCFAQCPTPMGQILFEHFHGAASRVGTSDTAFPHRSTGYSFLILCQWTEAAETDRCIAWARETYRTMEPFFAPTRYVNYLSDDEPAPSVAAAYGANHRRLQEVKAKYDPENFFRMNQNIRPLG